MNGRIREFLTTFAEGALDWSATTGLSIIVVLAVAYGASRILRHAIRRLRTKLVARAEKSARVEDPAELRQRVETLSGLLQRIGLIAIWGVAGVMVLKEAGVDIGPILAGAGIVGLAVGFGAQNLVRDVVSGFFIILENQVAVGDWAVINGRDGSVEAIKLRTIVLRDLAGGVHVFPNGSITTLSNMTKDWSAIVYEIGVAYREDTDHVVEVMRGVAEELQADGEYKASILEPIEIFGVESFADSAVVIKARQKTKPIQQWTVGREYRRRLKKAFDAAGIAIPFPQRTLTWNEEGRPFRVLMENRQEAQ